MKDSEQVGVEMMQRKRRNGYILERREFSKEAFEKRSGQLINGSGEVLPEAVGVDQAEPGGREEAHFG